MTTGKNVIIEISERDTAKIDPKLRQIRLNRDSLLSMGLVDVPEKPTIRTDEWSELLRLLYQSYWSVDDAVLILSGLHPSTIWSEDSSTREPVELVWLPHGRDLRWKSLKPYQVLNRIVRRVRIARRKLLVHQHPMTPTLWIAAAMLADIDPPWLAPLREQNRQWQKNRKQKKQLPSQLSDVLPPHFLTNRQMARKAALALHSNDFPKGRFESFKDAVRIEWEAWTFQEVEHSSKEAFLRIFEEDDDERRQRNTTKATAVKNPGIEPKTIREWIKSWEQECYLQYSVIQRNGKMFRGYNGLQGVNPVKSR